MKAFIYAVGLLVGAAGLWLLTLCLSILAGAVELSITGSAAGAGNQSLFFAGDFLNATWNGTAWQITAVTP